MRQIIIVMALILLTVFLGACSEEQSRRNWEGNQGAWQGERGDEPRNFTRNYSMMAEKIGVSEEALQTAMESQGMPPDFEAVAAQLNVDPGVLQDAMRSSRGRRGRR